jgi:hypothetical protein
LKRRNRNMRTLRSRENNRRFTPAAPGRRNLAINDCSGMPEAEVPGRSSPVCGSVVFSILLKHASAPAQLSNKVRVLAIQQMVINIGVNNHVRQSHFSQSFQTNEDSGELPVRVAFLEHAALVSDRTFRVMAGRRGPQKRQKRRSDGHNRRTSLFALLSARISIN